MPNGQTTGNADIDDGTVVWLSSPGRDVGDSYAIWLKEPDGRELLVERLSKGLLATGIGASLPYIVWVQYKELGNITGPWSVRVHDTRTQLTQTVARWKGETSAKAEPIPLPYVADHAVVWHQLIHARGKKPRFCIRSYDLSSNVRRSVYCTPDIQSFPHFPRVNDGHIAYVTNTGLAPQQRCGVSQPQREVAEPRSPSYPQLVDFLEQHPPDVTARIAEADGDGIAWIAEGLCYGEAGGIVYWEPGLEPVLRPERDPEFPAVELFLVGDAIVWSEPDVLNDVLAVRRELLGCESAASSVVASALEANARGPSAVEGAPDGANRYAIDLLGASEHEVVVSLMEPGTGRVVQQTLGVFPIPKLPVNCEQ